MKVTEFILCEDVRHETDDKVSLMGVMTHEVTVQAEPGTKFPVKLRLAVFVGIDIEDGDTPTSFEFGIKQGENQLISLKGLVDPDAGDGKRVIFIAGGDKLRLAGPGLLEMFFDVLDSGGARLLHAPKRLNVLLEQDESVAQSA